MRIKYYLSTYSEHRSDIACFVFNLKKRIITAWVLLVESIVVENSNAVAPSDILSFDYLGTNLITQVFFFKSHMGCSSCQQL